MWRQSKWNQKDYGGWLSRLCFTSLSSDQHNIGHIGDDYYRSKDPTNSIKVYWNESRNGFVKQMEWKADGATDGKSKSVVGDCDDGNRFSRWLVWWFPYKPTRVWRWRRHRLKPLSDFLGRWLVSVNDNGNKTGNLAANAEHNMWL